jgi:hypothetical protein
MALKKRAANNPTARPPTSDMLPGGTSPGQWGDAGVIGDQPPANAWGSHPNTGTYLGSHPGHPTDAGLPRGVQPDQEPAPRKRKP